MSPVALCFLEIYWGRVVPCWTCMWWVFSTPTVNRLGTVCQTKPPKRTWCGVSRTSTCIDSKSLVKEPLISSVYEAELNTCGVCWVLSFCRGACQCYWHLQSCSVLSYLVIFWRNSMLHSPLCPSLSFFVLFSFLLCFNIWNYLTFFIVISPWNTSSIIISSLFF